jgi:hypothetical protein
LLVAMAALYRGDGPGFVNWESTPCLRRIVHTYAVSGGRVHPKPFKSRSRMLTSMASDSHVFTLGALNPPNRRIRPRSYGGVGGAGGVVRLPLS